MFPNIKIFRPSSFLCIALVLLFITSCQKVINVNLNSTASKVVVDAVLTDTAGGCVVMLSQTKAFSDDNTFVGLSGAQVLIKQGNNILSNFTEVSPGIYTDSTLKGTYGTQYTLVVTVNNQTFSGTSTMPYKVPIDTAYINTQSFFGINHSFANVLYTDPVDTQNNYRFVQYINNKMTNAIFVSNDDYSDGKLQQSTLYYPSDSNSGNDSIVTGDVVKVQMLCIDANVYKYWFSLVQGATGSSNSATPANPISNLSGGCLGYFSAQTSQTKVMIAP